MKQPRSIAACDLAEVIESGPETADAGAVTLHGREQAVKAPPDLRASLAGRVGQQAGGGMNEAVSPLHLGPERRRPGQGAVNQLLEPRERTRRPPCMGLVVSSAIFERPDESGTGQG